MYYQDELEPIYTPEELAKYLKMPKVTMWQYLREGRIESIKLGRKYRIRKSAVDTFLRECENSIGK